MFNFVILYPYEEIFDALPSSIDFCLVLFPTKHGQIQKHVLLGAQYEKITKTMLTWGNIFFHSLNLRTFNQIVLNYIRKIRKQ